jgi:hypothetical protein
MTKTMQRVVQGNPYTQIQNTPLQDERLSVEAVGLLVCMLSLPRDWKFSRKHAQKRFNMGREKLDRIVKELTAFGYIRTTQERSDRGQYGRRTYFFTAHPSAPMESPPDAEELRGVPYGDYLQSAHWQNLRKRKIDSAGGRCQICNFNDSLSVHHRTYDRLGAEPLEDLTVLCRHCHGLFHDHSRLFVEAE